MGNPLHYSVELPQWCLQLIDDLWPLAEQTRQRSAPGLGPLSTTSAPEPQRNLHREEFYSREKILILRDQSMAREGGA
jgi:hypothetical protein